MSLDYTYDPLRTTSYKAMVAANKTHTRFLDAPSATT
jgi:hypothetical protein